MVQLNNKKPRTERGFLINVENVQATFCCRMMFNALPALNHSTC